MNRTKTQTRTNLITVFTLLVFLVFGGVLVYYQIFAGADQISDSSVKKYYVKTDAPRGEILDTNGNALVYNEQVNVIIFEYLDFPAETQRKTEVILRLINLIESKGEQWLNTIPITLGADGRPAFTDDSEASVSWMKSSAFLDVNEYADAGDCLNVLKELYGLYELTDEQALKVGSVYYRMAKMYFSANDPYTFAENISDSTVAYIKENGDLFPGVDVKITTKRKYIGDGTLACHILGTVGAIDRDEYNQKTQDTKDAIEKAETKEEKAEIEANAYSVNDRIGKNGIEYAEEDYLRGKKGEKVITVDGNGNTTEDYSVVPVKGCNIYLSIDSHLQEICDQSLEKQIKLVTNTSALEAEGLTPAGAVVVMDVTTGAVLASSSYPNFPLSTYYEDYAELSQDPGKPLWNRAFQSTYSPGSTMKPVIAIAALEEGIITPDSVVYCDGLYEYIDQVFACFGKTAHGGVTVRTALEYSCNIFFFEMARQLGIETMNSYSSLFGLGQKTGIEISESEGILAGYAERAEQGLGWKPGETLLAAIGQSDNSFSPLQLCNYCATIANGGTRYVPYLVKRITGSDHKTEVFSHEPQIAVQTNISEKTISAVKDGMYLVANEGSCRDYLGHLKYPVACKTGTAEKSFIINGRIVNGTDGFLITFGPFESAKIAIAVVIENAGSGASTAQVAQDIYEYYFSTLDKDDSVRKENTVLW